MLPRHARLTLPNDFARTTKSGFRLTGKSLVLYLYPSQESTTVKFGLIISKSVGGSVVRHRVARQIRHGLQEHISKFPTGVWVVVRVLPFSLKGDIREELTTLILKSLKKLNVTQ